MKLGILYICTGNYTVFWKEFYESCEKWLLPDCEKYYYVFTDADEIDYEKNNSHIRKVFQENLGWPNNTLKRYHIFLKHKNLYADMDYLYFFNANLKIVKLIKTEDFLPEKGKIMVTIHPGYYNKINSQFPYERNDISTAYIPEGEGEYYIAGGLNGGERDVFLGMAEQLKRDIDQDENINYVACWHDESHINNFIYCYNNFQLLSPAYLYPEGWDIPFIPKILIRDKNNYGGHSALREGNYEDFCRRYEHLYIYGAGVKGRRLWNILQEKKINVEGFIISNDQTKPEDLNVKFLSELKDPNADTGIIIAMNQEYAGNIKLLCQNSGYKNIYIS